MKYYIGEIVTYIGEGEDNTTLKFKTKGKPEDYLDLIASDFWGDGAEQDFDTGLYDFGDRMAGVGHWQEIDAATYNKLAIITEMQRGEIA